MRNEDFKLLTQKQKNVYERIKEYFQTHHQSPTVTELAKILDFNSLRTVTQYLDILERKGFITRRKNKQRGIRLTEDDKPRADLVSLPVVSAAGCDNLSVYADAVRPDFIVSIDRHFLNGRKPSQVLVIEAKGQSMVDAGIKDGDYVLVERTQDIQNGDKVAAVVAGMAVIKQIRFSENAVTLVPMSPDKQYRPIIAKSQESLHVFGKMIDVIRNIHNEPITYEPLME